MSQWSGPRPVDAKPPGDVPGLLIYEPYYGLAEKPFSLSTDPRFLYRSASHTPVFHDLLGAIRRREGLIVLTGEIGTGKTTLCRSVLGHLDRKTFATFVPDPFLTREDLLKMLLVDFGVVAVDDIVQGRLRGASRPELSYPLYDFLKSLAPLDAYAVLLIDEAQNLPLPLLEEIRVLSDLEDGRKLLQVVLIGQPELSAALRLPRMRQVEQRVSTHCELHPLTREGVYGYVGHRLAVAGATPDQVHFSGDALDMVFEASCGTPRVINLLCDRALQRAHAARASRVGPECVAGAMADLRLTAVAALATPALRVTTMDEAAARANVPATPIPVADAGGSGRLSQGDAPAPAQPVPVPPTAPTPVSRGLFEKATSAQAPAPPSDDLHALLSLPPTVSRPSVEEAREERGRHASRRTRQEHRPEPRGRAAGIWTSAALTVLGAVTGLGLATYWLWLGPLVVEQVALPSTPPAAWRAGAPRLVLGPDAPGPAGAGASLPPAAVTAAGPTRQGSQSAAAWAVQVGAFSSADRAAALAERLSTEGLTAYASQTSPGPRGRLYLVLVGPFATRPEADAALDRAQRLPGLEQALIRTAP